MHHRISGKRAPPRKRKKHVYFPYLVWFWLGNLGSKGTVLLLVV